MNEQQLKQAFMLYLQQKSGAKTQQEFEAFIQLLGEEGLQLEYAQFMLLLQLQQVAARKFGGMLNYIGQLRGVCPEGTEMQFFRQGGQVCKKCVKKAKMEEGGTTPQNPVDAFRCGRKMKKKAACGTKLPKHSRGTNDGGVTLKKEVRTDNGEEETITRTWSDGTTSKKISNEGGTVYHGRKREVGITNVPSRHLNEIADSLERVDWGNPKRGVPTLKKPIKKKANGGGFVPFQNRGLN